MARCPFFQHALFPCPPAPTRETGVVPPTRPPAGTPIKHSAIAGVHVNKEPAGKQEGTGNRTFPQNLPES